MIDSTANRKHPYTSRTLECKGGLQESPDPVTLPYTSLQLPYTSLRLPYTSVRLPYTLDTLPYTTLH
jgi:hypothetical protein